MQHSLTCCAATAFLCASELVCSCCNTKQRDVCVNVCVCACARACVCIHIYSRSRTASLCAGWGDERGRVLCRIARRSRCIYVCVHACIAYARMCACVYVCMYTHTHISLSLDNGARQSRATTIICHEILPTFCAGMTRVAAAWMNIFGTLSLVLLLLLIHHWQPPLSARKHACVGRAANIADRKALW
jgi:hypothetical protein